MTTNSEPVYVRRRYTVALSTFAVLAWLAGWASLWAPASVRFRFDVLSLVIEPIILIAFVRGAVEIICDLDQLEKEKRYDH